MTEQDDSTFDSVTGPSTRALIARYQKSTTDAHMHLANDEFQQAMALYFDASQSADEMTERFFTLLIKTAPSISHKTLIVEALSWRLRYFSTQYDYHLAVAQTLTGLPREEWIARLETILMFSQSLVSKMLPMLRDVKDVTIKQRICDLMVDWVDGIRDLVTNLQSWGMASAQASQVLEWALDNNLQSTSPDTCGVVSSV